MRKNKKNLRATVMEFLMEERRKKIFSGLGGKEIEPRENFTLI